MKERLQREVGVVAVIAAVERGGKRSSAGGGLNCRLLEPGSALVDAGTTFDGQGGTASVVREAQVGMVPDALPNRGVGQANRREIH